VAEIPDWVADAWSTLDADAELDRVLSAHLEGRLMESEHPSYAMVAFVGTMEPLGARLTTEITVTGRGLRTVASFMAPRVYSTS
jgi:hypothetical protein